MEILNVLIVEDIPMAQKLCQMIIHDTLNTPSDIASDGQEALEKFKAGQFDLILMDIGLPILNGIEATRAIRDYEKQNNRSPTIIIALTANEKADIKEECFDIFIETISSDNFYNYCELNNKTLKDTNGSDDLWLSITTTTLKNYMY